MARTGNFGRLPRAVPSLTNTLIAIAHEQQQQEDTNIMDAWQKGGMVDGHKVTDSMVLAHWKARLTDISKDDPLYDTYKNAVTQYEYSIAESKVTAAYAQIAAPKAADDDKVSAFYMNWSKKIPKDSEFYRILLRDAGQYIRSAKAKRDALIKDNSEKMYKSQMDRLEKTNELPGQTALRTFAMLGQKGSQGRGAVLGETPLGMPGGVVNTTNMADLQLPDVDQMIALIGTVMTGMNEGDHNGRLRVSPNAQTLYTDENGKPVTGTQIVAAFKQADPTFDGKFTMAYVQGLVVKQRDGLQKRIDLAKKTGHISDAMSLSMEQAKVNEYANEIKALPVASEYARLHKALSQAMTDADTGKLLPDAAADTITKIRGQIGALAGDKRIAGDGHMQSQLRDEANGKLGASTLAEDLAGTHGDVQNAATSDIAYTNERLDLWKTQKDEVTSGQKVYTQGNYVKGADGKTTFVAATGGKSIGAATMAEINNLPGYGKPVPIMIPNGDGGGATPAYVVPAPILASQNAPDGGPLQATNSNPVGGFIKVSYNGVESTIYTIERNGKTEWTLDPPFDQSKTQVSVSDGVMHVNLYPHGDSPVSKLTDEQYNTNGPIGGGYEIVGAGYNEAQGVPIKGHIEYNPAQVLLGTDQSRQAAGHDPYTDSYSASLAIVRTTPDGPNLLKQWSGDPRFEMILEQNAHLAAGQSLDTNTGQWTGGDQNAYQNNLNSSKRDMDWAQTGNRNDSNPALRDAWWRDGTNTSMAGAGPLSVPGPNGQATIPGHPPTPLATTVIQQQTGSPMAMLGAAFNANGAVQYKGKQQDDLGPQIKLGKPLTVPQIAANATPKPPPAPAATTAAGAPASTTATTAPAPTSGYTNHEPLSTPHSGYGNHAV